MGTVGRAEEAEEVPVMARGCPDLRELLLLLAKALVDHPDQVQVQQVEGQQSVILEIRVAPEDVGKIIGKQGRIIRAIRAVIKAAAAKEGKKAAVEVLQ